jgi:hypothetical protein
MIKRRRISEAIDEQIKKVEEVKKETKAPKKTPKKKKGE